MIVEPGAVRARALLLDMDGTLIDSTKAVERMWSGFAQTFGLDVAEVLEFSHGTPSIATLRRFLPPSEDLEQWLVRVAHWEDTRFDDLQEVAGARTMLESLPARSWAVVTSAFSSAAYRRFEQIGLPRPEVLIGADDVAHGKPDPEGYLRAAHDLGVEPRDCLVAEDSPAGLAAALDAGCLAVVVGGLDHPVADGLPRIVDWRGVTVKATGAWLEVSGLPA